MTWTPGPSCLTSWCCGFLCWAPYIHSFICLLIQYIVIGSLVYARFWVVKSTRSLLSKKPTSLHLCPEGLVIDPLYRGQIESHNGGMVSSKCLVFPGMILYICLFPVSPLLESAPGMSGTSSVLFTAVVSVPRNVPGTEYVLHICLWKGEGKQGGQEAGFKPRLPGSEPRPSPLGSRLSSFRLPAGSEPDSEVLEFSL